MTTTAMKRLAHLVSDKWIDSYSIAMGWLRCKITFCLLLSALACLRGLMPRTDRDGDFTTPAKLQLVAEWYIKKMF